MIYDKIENLAKYEKINEGIKEVVEYIKNNDLMAIPVGKQSISERVNINRQQYDGKDEVDNKYESHIKYIDVQVILDSEEKCNVSFDKAVVTEINEKDFYTTETEEKDVVLKIKKGEFAIFFPGELHKPGLKVNDKKIEKIIFKVLAD